MSSKPIGVLLIDHNTTDADSIRDLLAAPGDPSFRVEWCNRLALDLAAVAASRPDVILLALSCLPDLQALASVQAQFPQSPIVLLVRPGEEELAVQAIREGACGFVVKAGLNRHKLVGAILTGLDRKQLQDELRAQKQLSDSLVAVARATAEQPTLQATLRNALDVAVSLTRAAHGDLFLMDERGGVIECILPPNQVLRREDLIGTVMDKGLAGWVAAHRQPALLADTTQDERWLPLPDDPYGVRAALSIPISTGPALVGVLTLVHPQPGYFTEEHLQIMQAAGDQMALAVRNAQIFEAQRRMTDRQITLYEVLRAVSGQLDPDVVVRLAVDAVVRLAGWPNASIALRDKDEAHWTICAASGRLAPAHDLRFSMDQGVIGRALRTGQTQLVGDVRTDPDYQSGHAAIQSELAAPLKRRGRVLGVLNMESDRLAAFNAEDVVLAESLAEAVALALDNAQLYAQVRQHANDLSALYAITRTTSQSLALQDVLAQTLASALSLLGFEGGLIGLTGPDGDGLRVVAQRGLPAAHQEQLAAGSLEESLCGYVCRQRESLVIGNLDREAPPGAGRMAAELASLGWRGFVGIPLLRQKESPGVLCLFARQPREATPYNLALLTTIGHQIATVVENARLFQSTLNDRSHLQALIKSSRDGIILVGTNMRLLVINAPALQFLHLPGEPEDWLGRELREVLLRLRTYAPAVIRPLREQVRRLRTGDESPGEGEFEAPPYAIRWLSLPVLAGTVQMGRLILLHDVTVERAVEQLRDDMVRTMVHDLRNPLGSIMTALELLSTGYAGSVLEPRQLQVVEIAQNTTQRMLALVTSILDISRLESGRMPLEQDAFALEPVVADLFQVQAPLAAEKDIRLESDIPFALPVVWADVELIGRVLQNLVGNAVKFTPAGGTVYVAARSETSAGRPAVLVTVSDTGPGIPAEVQGRLFQKFVAGQQEGRGSGLGLAFCKLAVEAHGERIWVESTPGRGATFTFSLAVAPLPE